MKRCVFLLTAIALAIGMIAPSSVAAAGPATDGSTKNLHPRVIATFPTGYEFNSFAESLAVAPGGELYATVTIWKDGTSDVGKLYRIGPGGRMRQVGPDLAVGILSGLAFDDRGYLYAGVIAFGPGDEPAGVLRFAPDGSVTRAVTLPEGTFPNGLAFHDGALYIADSGFGAIWKAYPAMGRIATLTEPWIEDPTLAPTGGLGVNGIAFRGGALYGVNADTGAVVRIPVNRNGGAGRPSLVVAPNADMIGADGVAFDVDGGLWVAINHGDETVGGALVRVGPYGHPTVVANDPGWLDYPAQPAFGVTQATRTTLYVVNGSLNTGNCNVIALNVGVAGAPLP